MRRWLNAAFGILLLSGCNLASNQQQLIEPAVLEPPSVTILAPTNMQQVYEGTVFDIDVVARDILNGVGKVELFVDETRENQAAPLEAPSVPVFRAALNWRAQGIGLHVIEVWSYRADDTPLSSQLITIEVIPRG